MPTRHCSCSLTNLYFSTLSVPSNTPKNVNATARSPTSIQVTWETVPDIDQNGDIIVYEVRYDPLETFGGQIGISYTNTSNGSVLETTLKDLQEFVEYNISVRAYTMVGPGPFNMGILTRTFEAGE